MTLLKNNKISGILAVVALEVVVALLLWIGLLIAGKPTEMYLRWFAACFVAPILLLRHLAKKKSMTIALKSSIVTLFVTFVAFMAILFKTNSLSL